MAKVLIINPYYLPGYRSGGPQRTIENLVDYFGETNDIYILTQDHDFESSLHYDGITNNIWVKVGNARVMYVSSKDYKWKALREAYDEFDTIYSCGLFEQNSVFLLLLHRLKRKKDKRVFIAPMGVFSEGSFYNNSHIKKREFIAIYKTIGAFNNITWSFTTEDEVHLAEKVLGRIIDNYIIAEDLPRKIDFAEYRSQLKYYEKEPGKINLVYISRIPPKKNLLYALKLLNFKYDGEIRYDIYGIKEDEKYWQECENEIQKLPDNVHVEYCGELKPEQVVDTFSKYDAFLLPTKGENFGHIIYEALCAGCIPIISNLTPWSAECLIVRSLGDDEGFQSGIKRIKQMDTKELIEARRKCINFAETFYKRSTDNTGYNIIFR